MNEYLHIIREIGFPIFVSLVLLFRIEPTIRQLQKTIDKILFYMEHSDRK